MRFDLQRHLCKKLSTPIFCGYNKYMIFTYDQVKNQSNKNKHGVYLADACHLDWNAMMATEDTSMNYGEERYLGLTYGLAILKGCIYAVVFTYDDSDDDEIYHIISLRKATKVEVQKYAKA
ncbi:BrnT family toxin [Rahnella aceris]|uniref:BrnT family toxin n=1 Tax=Rahnella sp. (strain Y9602) TaxID=2703885 RepID=UPI003FD21923